MGLQLQSKALDHLRLTDASINFTKTSAFTPKRTLVTGYRSAIQLLYLGRKDERA